MERSFRVLHPLLKKNCPGQRPGQQHILLPSSTFHQTN
ncbi:hypothetical protein Cabys_1774 [Caldithrix abyssi DSM 13497]|uniref:Uncharacterized protein n=1 Tax=Caldithrix abyssi DSM 13497 TaxID=880073 RepID=A0A1J1C756_CALAY|nr:hypothetical protein Cabys_1774 [Caldithrix abyssi DSM 13497]